MFPQQSVVIDLFKISPAVKLKFHFRHCNRVHRKNLLPSDSASLLRHLFTSFLVQGSNACYMLLIYRQHRIISVLLYHSSSNSTFTTLFDSFITASNNFVIQTLVAVQTFATNCKKFSLLKYCTQYVTVRVKGKF